MNWAKWLKASMGMLEVTDHSAYRWIDLRNIPMMNYILLKRSPAQEIVLPKEANLASIPLRRRFLILNLRDDSEGNLMDLSAQKPSIK